MGFIQYGCSWPNTYYMCTFCEITLSKGTSHGVRSWIICGTGLRNTLNVKKANWLVFLEAISFAPQRPSSFAFYMDPLCEKKGGPVPASKDNSAHLHYSLYAQLIEGLFLLSS